MSVQKHIIALGLVIAALLVINTRIASGSNFAPKYDYHDINFGKRQPGDRAVIVEKVVKEIDGWLKTMDEERSFNTTGNDRITLIQALDQTPDERFSGTACIFDGGIGDTEVTIRFKSYIGHGVNYLVRIFAVSP